MEILNVFICIHKYLAGLHNHIVPKTWTHTSNGAHGEKTVFKSDKKQCGVNESNFHISQHSYFYVQIDGSSVELITWF